MNLKSTKYLLLVLSIFVLVSCGGSGDTDVASPGELAPLTAPSGTDNFAATTSTLLTGTCPSSPFISDNATLGGNTLCAISGPITSDLTLTTDVMYRLSGLVDVGKDMGGNGLKAGGVSATLTIPAGVTLAQKTPDDYLVVQRGSKIMANGTRSNPIRFTAASAIDGSLTNPDSASGLWGGIVILGKAPINRCAAANLNTADCERVVEGSTTAIMGGATPTDNSGVLNFVRVEYAGKEIFPGNELNGITFGGVGSGTEVDYVQVHNNQDDCVEFFGGTVNASNLLVWGQGDDGLDIDQSYAGTISNAIVIANSTSDHGLEIDGPEGSMNDSFKLENITLIGDGTAGNGEYADFRKGALGSVNNLFAYGFQVGKDFELDAEADSASFEAGTLTFSNIEIIIPDGSSLTGGDLFNDKSDTPNAMFEDAKNLDGETFGKGVTKETSSVGADRSAFSWTFANYKGKL